VAAAIEADVEAAEGAHRKGPFERHKQKG
jgi:hypothetical protein